ncbi:hypothetical protein HQO83_23465 [Rhodococcus fascians]|nr:hypothetical protein [Rhodococcus fascians]
MPNSDYERWKTGSTPQAYTGSPVQAVRVDETNADDIVIWIEAKGLEASNRDGAVEIGHVIADVGTWVVVTASNHVMTLDDATFSEMYEHTPPPLIGG